MKKIIVHALCIILIIAVLLPSVFATESNSVQPRYTYTRMFVAEIDITNSVATCSATFSTYNHHDLKLLCHLQQNIDGTWKTISRWSEETSNSLYVTSERICGILIGEQYRFVAYGYVYSGDSLLESAYKYAT